MSAKVHISWKDELLLWEREGLKENADETYQLGNLTSIKQRWWYFFTPREDKNTIHEIKRNCG